MNSTDFMVLARFWMAQLRLPRTASPMYARHIIRFKNWCETVRVEPLAVLFSDGLNDYYDWMGEKQYAKRTLDHNKKAFDQFSRFLLEVPADVVDQSGWK